MVTGNMTRAADMIGIAQPSVSAMISNLEHELGFKLFVRQRGRLVATPEAKHILPNILRTLESVEVTRQNARQIRERHLGDLTIAAYPDIAIDFLPRVISEFLSDGRKVQINLHARRSEMMSGLIPTQQFDMAIATQVADDHGLEIESHFLRCVCAVPDGHVLSAKPAITPADLSEERIVGLLPEHATAGQLSEAFASHFAKQWRPDIQTQTFESASSFVRNGAGIAILDPITAVRYEGNGLAWRPFEPAIVQRIFILIPKERPRSQVLFEFHQRLKSELAKFEN